MERQEIDTVDEIARNQHFSLLELLDRLLDKGVIVKGEILLSVANIDLVYLNLGLLLSSVKTVKNVARGGSNRETQVLSYPIVTEEEVLCELQPEVEVKDFQPALLGEESSLGQTSRGEMLATTLPSVVDNKPEQIFEQKTNADSANVEKGLTKLVLTLIELVRKLMEKQAIRRIEADQLSAVEIENVGDTFFLLDERMKQLKDMFGLGDEDLNLDLGPLGDLL